MSADVLHNHTNDPNAVQVRLNRAQEVQSDLEAGDPQECNMLLHIWFLLMEAETVTNQATQTFAKISEENAERQAELNEDMNMIQLQNIEFWDCHEVASNRWYEPDYDHRDPFSGVTPNKTGGMGCWIKSKKVTNDLLDKIHLNNEKADAHRSYLNSMLLSERQSEQTVMSKLNLMDDQVATSQQACGSVMDLLGKLSQVLFSKR